MNAELIANHFGISQQRFSNLSSAKSIISSNNDSSIESFKMIQVFYAISKYLQIYLNYNRDHCTNSCAIDCCHVYVIYTKDHTISYYSLTKQSTS